MRSFGLIGGHSLGIPSPWPDTILFMSSAMLKLRFFLSRSACSGGIIAAANDAYSGERAKNRPAENQYMLAFGDVYLWKEGGEWRDRL